MAEGRAAVEIFTDAKELQRAVGVGDGERLHAHHAHKCPHMHAVEARRQGERRHPLAVIESVIADIPHALAQTQRRNQAIAGEGVVADAGHGRHCHALQLGTFFERIGTNRCHSGIKRDVGEVRELLERAGAHLGALAAHG